MFGIGDGDTGARCGMCSGLAIKTLERRHWRRAGVFFDDFGHDWRLVLVFLWASKCWVLVILMTRFLLTNDIFYFVVIFCSIIF